MIRKTLIAGNWKMNKTIIQTVDFIMKLKEVKIPGHVDVLICPTFVSLGAAGDLLKGSKIKLGAQNMHFEENGAFTGEISPQMIKTSGCDYVILGHSERRHIFLEEDEFINKKVKAALECNLKPILCVGETLEQRHEGETKEVVKNQLLMGLEGVEDIRKVTIAYEPVWAIGTGENATPTQAEEVHGYIRSLMEGRYNKESAHKLRILYGGSVNPGNINSLMDIEDIDGALVGGASVDLEKFKKLIYYED